jgi:hypothetical protein
MWLALFLSKEYRQYPGMSMDALFGGLLLAVASALHDADVLSDLSKKGVKGGAKPGHWGGVKVGHYLHGSSF